MLVYPAGAVVAVWSAATEGVPISVVITAGIIFLCTSLGMAVGHHSYFSHRSFCAHRAVEALLIIFGCAGFGSFLGYAAEHRRHHRFSDEAPDTHSPYRFGTDSVQSRIRGLWYAHLSWTMDSSDAMAEVYIPDLIEDPFYRVMDRLAGVWMCLVPGAAGAAGYFATGDWRQAGIGLAWGLLALCVSIHIHLCTNSVAHTVGAQAYVTGDESRNVPLLGVIGFGLGWHNNHHAFPASLRSGFDAGQIDPGAAFVTALSRVGLTWKIVPPPGPAAREARRRKEDS